MRRVLRPSSARYNARMGKGIAGKGARREKRRRISKDEYYLDIAQRVASRSTCLRRGFGAVIVNNDQIIATGYNGAPRKTRNCMDVGVCYRDQVGARPGENYELCRGVHAEMNAIIHASRFDMLGGTMYVAGIDPVTQKSIPGAGCCRLCKRMIINAGIERVVIREGAGGLQDIPVRRWIRSNLGELKRKGGRFVPVKVSGY